MNNITESEYDALLHGVAKQMASSQLSKRQSRSSGTPTPNRFSARIEKPCSTHPSPRRLERRRTTASVKPYVSLDDHYNAMFGPGKIYEASSNINVDRLTLTEPSVRPVSWHPTSMKTSQSRFPFVEQLYSTGNDDGGKIAKQMAQQNDVAGIGAENARLLESMNSTASASQSMHSGYQSYSFSSPYWSSSQATRATWCVSPTTPDPTPFSQIYPQPELDTFYTSMPLRPSQSSSGVETSLTSQPAMEESYSMSNDLEEPEDFLPMQRPPPVASAATAGSYNYSESGGPCLQTIQAEEYSLSSPMSGDDQQQDLVGMGLYDPPESGATPVPTGLPREAKGKGLKLEETWKPPQGLLLPEEHDEQEDFSSDTESEASTGAGVGSLGNDNYIDFAMDEEMGVLSMADRNELLAAQRMVPATVAPAVTPAQSMAQPLTSSIVPAAKAAPADGTFMSGYVPSTYSDPHVPVSTSTTTLLPLQQQPLPPPPSASLAGQSFFLDDDDAATSSGAGLWYAPMRTTPQAMMLGSAWF